MNILMCGNDRVYPGIELVVYSTLTHNRNINWYIFTMDIELKHPNGEVIQYYGLHEWHKNRLNKIIQYLDPTSKITFIDTYELYMKYFANSPNEFSGFTPYAPLRLLADIALPNIEHILYLDCDTAVCGDISDMYYSYLKLGKEYYAYMIPDVYGYKGEMISGVMLMDLNKIRETGYLGFARQNIQKEYYKFYDQGALNEAGLPYPLPEKYSYVHDLNKCAEKPIIIHFTNELSPKIYDDNYGRTYFFKKYPFLSYVKDGVELLDTINWGERCAQ